MVEELWGEIPVRLGISQAEREAITTLQQVPLLEGPKLFQPQPGDPRIKTEPRIDDILVTKNIELLRYRRQITRLLETLEQQKAAVSSGETGDLPPLLQPPPLPAPAEFTRSAKTSIFGFPMKEEKVLYSTEIPEITRKDAELGLKQAVIKISAHVGYQTALDSGVRLLTESTQLFMERMLHNLRIELDRSLENNMENMGWTDILEKVLVGSGAGSILSIQDYYEDSIIKFNNKLLLQCKALRDKYCSSIPSDIRSWSIQGIQEDDDIPQLHFPSSEEGAGMGETSMDHTTPNLDVGMQMLQSLEASGDLDTPRSADSEALSNMSCTTPSPAFTPRTLSSSPQFNSAKKRRRSGGKYI
ncbi:STAGA complex 65 subunit gamma [Eurytemora carolleeae]|uniref:STAGA complex 65 subunit gamma n=1 Tax=Eurytemora carolleeae TaxID=1294199 RepID=UPI000C775BD7|nr:STAGA complex 65 subunit gamma [Eurytemora carolleeae]|eukprot:XP_023330512.1 STAGA complex 65 subunit gamma-like [Eurytemora affinis]